MWVTKISISPVKKGFFAPKRPNLSQNWHFWSNWAKPCRLFRCPVVGRLVIVARELYLARHLFTLYYYYILLFLLLSQQVHCDEVVVVDDENDKDDDDLSLTTMTKTATTMTTIGR